MLPSKYLKLFLLLLGCFQGTLARLYISNPVKNALATGPATIILDFHTGNTEEIHRKFKENRLSGTTWGANDDLVQELKENAERVQRKTIGILEQELGKISGGWGAGAGAGAGTEAGSGTRQSFDIGPFEIRQLWISNQLVVRGVDKEIIPVLKRLEDVSRVTVERRPKIAEQSRRVKRGAPKKARQQGGGKPVVWGAKSIEVDKAWFAGFKGEGVVVGIIDTGVRGTHEALRDNFRTPYGWYDPESKTAIPHDPKGHGTHVAGTIVGTKYGIGMAPKAKWIACRGVTQDYAEDPYGSTVKECLQWMTCPTDPQGGHPDCSQKPQIVINSWYYRENPGQTPNKTFENDLAVLVTSGIVSIAPIGNNGPKCESGLTPGESVQVISVGLHDESLEIGAFSSFGPTLENHIKPEVMGPGTNIWSAFKDTDQHYDVLTGTSMAAAHVAGVAALYLGVFRNATVEQFKHALFNATSPTQHAEDTCGNVSQDIFPNNHQGYGRVIATKILKQEGLVLLADSDNVRSSTALIVLLPLLLLAYHYQALGKGILSSVWRVQVRTMGR